LNPAITSHHLALAAVLQITLRLQQHLQDLFVAPFRRGVDRGAAEEIRAAAFDGILGAVVQQEAHHRWKAQVGGGTQHVAATLVLPNGNANREFRNVKGLTELVCACQFTGYSDEAQKFRGRRIFLRCETF